MFSGGAVGRFSLALLGVGPYITASIAFQLLTMLIPQLEVLQKEGEYGRRKINQYTRLASVPLAFIEGYGLIKLLVNQNVVRIENNWDMFMVLSIVTASSVLLMWLGEIISEKGIGNGVSMIIAIGIIAGLPQSIQSLVQVVAGNPTQIFMACIYGLIILAMIVVIIWVTLAERRIQVTYARRVASSRTASNVESYLPLKINAAGVIPIIFATSILVIPGFLAQLFADARSDWLRSVANTVSSLINNNYVYASLFFVLIVAFTFSTFQSLLSHNRLPKICKNKEALFLVCDQAKRPPTIFTLFCIELPLPALSFGTHCHCTVLTAGNNARI